MLVSQIQPFFLANKYAYVQQSLFVKSLHPKDDQRVPLMRSSW